MSAYFAACNQRLQLAAGGFVALGQRHVVRQQQRQVVADVAQAAGRRRRSVAAGRTGTTGQRSRFGGKVRALVNQSRRASIKTALAISLSVCLVRDEQSHTLCTRPDHPRRQNNQRRKARTAHRRPPTPSWRDTACSAVTRLAAPRCRADTACTQRRLPRRPQIPRDSRRTRCCWRRESGRARISDRPALQRR